MENNSIKREVAVKTKIKDILEGKYVKEEGWKPNYIITELRENISRANIIGVVVSEPNIEEKSQSLTIDDGSGRILLRSFENNIVMSKFFLGDVINIIGKPKEYLGSKYIIPEIMRKVEDKKWIEVRKKELEIKESKTEKIRFDDNKNNNFNDIKNNSDYSADNKAEVEEDVVDEKSDVDKIISMIKILDSGDGVFIEDVLKKLNYIDGEKMINSLMEQGEIFEIQPGKIKILE